MQNILILFMAFAALTKLSHCLTNEADTKTQYFVANPKSLDYKFTGKKDEHRFGVELKENKQFHHTKTAEDGVRLGCYGHELEGKKYSTSYVADGKGYRLVPDQGLITVYPKDGSEPRKASFVQSFNEEEINSANIRYFFPEGCQSPKIEIDASFKLTPPERKIPDIPVQVEQKIPQNQQAKTSKSIDFDKLKNRQNDDEYYEKTNTDTPQASSRPQVSNNALSQNPPQTSSFIRPETSTTKEVLTTPKSELTTPDSKLTTPNSELTTTIPESSSPTEKNTPLITKPNDKYGPPTFDLATPSPEQPTPPNDYITPTRESSKSQTFFPTTPFSNISPFARQFQTTPSSKKCSDTCCDDNRPQILMSRASPESCCRGVGKIVIPIEMSLLAKISMEEIIQVTSEPNNIEMLKKLLKLAEKYNF